MSRSDTIDIITRHLPHADTATLEAIRDVLMSDSAVHTRTLSDQDLAALDQSKSDFAAGRTLSFDELNEFLDASADGRAAKRAR